MSSASSDRHPVEQLAEEFIERQRRGERPSLTEYTARYPDLAEEIRDLFPALWNTQTLQQLASLPLQNSAVVSLAFDADGSRLAVSGYDEVVTVWDLGLLRAGLAELGLDWDHPPLARRSEKPPLPAK
jgi:hypothetical protein